MRRKLSVAWLGVGALTRVLGLALLCAAMAALSCEHGPVSGTLDGGPTPPAGMIYVPGGTTHIGSEDGPPEERPVFPARVEPFFMDIHPVTVGQFRRFVEATRYVTGAERAGDAGVYDPASDEWRLVPGATWDRPLGPAGPLALDTHPVTQVTWHDAVAYADWAGKRLPTEVEWEHAARGARNRAEAYAWGRSLIDRGMHRANTWQTIPAGGGSPEDGYVYTSPVGVFGTTELGLSDMGGNVWQWTSDWFAPYGGQAAASSAPGEKVQRGGSFLCHEQFCHGYRVSARSRSTPDTALYHVGFRCVRDPR